VIFLVDRNIEGYATLLLGTLTVGRWLELVPIDFVFLEDIGLDITSSDRVIWRFAQANQMILFTANRSGKGIDSLEQTIQEENTQDSLPVITLGNTDRMVDFEY
jgi:predicted nuclease of predicted toxin-antitoxin system